MQEHKKCMVYCLKTGCIEDSIVIIIVDPIKAHHATMLHCYLLFTLLQVGSWGDQFVIFLLLCNLISTKVPPRPSIQKILNKYIFKI